MTRLEDMEDKKDIIKKYYAWLLETNDITLEKEMDLSLVPTYNDPFVYYPDCMHDLFHTSCLQRLSRISQLSSMFQSYSGAYHSRLDHSIGVFNQKQEEHIYLWLQNPDFVRYVEENHLKKFLIAEEIKMLYHDVGHLPFSHVTEHQIIGQKGIHEDIGDNTSRSHPEVLAALEKLGISDEFQTVLTTDVLNSHVHDSGNIDVDRKDFLRRDSLHLGASNSLVFPIFSRKIAQINEDGSYKRSSDGSILLVDSISPNSKFIDVYSNNDLKNVEAFLNTREDLYLQRFYHPSTLARDIVFGFVQTQIATQYGHLCPQLMEYINFIKSGDYASAIKFDELDIYKSLLNVGLNCENDDVIDMISLMFIPFNNWLQLISTNIDGSKDADFINHLYRDVIKGTNRFAKNVKDKYFFQKNVMLFEGNTPPEFSHNAFSELITSSHSLSAYNPQFPEYVEDAEGKVYPLHEHPQRSRDWNNTKSSSAITICILPLLRLRGLSNTEIDSYVSKCKKSQSSISVSVPTPVNSWGYRPAYGPSLFSPAGVYDEDLDESLEL